MRKRLVVYFPLADPRVPVERLDIYVAAGVDVVECGWPALDPYLDGPDVTASMARARGLDPVAALAKVRERLARGRFTPKTLVMTYAEPDHAVLRDPGALAGVDALLVVGRPADPLRQKLEAAARGQGAEIAVFLGLQLAAEDVKAARGADFYAMLQAAPGLTGPRADLDEANRDRIANLRSAGMKAPILLGFGISDGAQARAAVEFGAEGIVVGSAALRAALAGEAALSALLSDLRRGLDG